MSNAANETVSGLSFGAAISRVFSKYAVFTGRATRSEFWWWMLFGLLVNIAVTVVFRFAGDTTVNWVSSLVSLALFLPNFGVLFRRLHDTGRSGWWWLIALIPLAGFIILIVFTASESQPSDNSYGPAPTPAQ